MIAAVLVYRESFIAGGVVFLIGSILDVFDGAVARARGEDGPKGAIFDSVLDRTFPTGNGGVPIRELVDQTVTAGPTEVTRTDRMREIVVTATLTDIRLSEAIERAETVLAQIDFPAGYRYVVAGEQGPVDLERRLVGGLAVDRDDGLAVDQDRVGVGVADASAVRGHRDAEDLEGLALGVRRLGEQLGVAALPAAEGSSGGFGSRFHGPASASA